MRLNTVKMPVIWESWRYEHMEAHVVRQLRERASAWRIEDRYGHTEESKKWPV